MPHLKSCSNTRKIAAEYAARHSADLDYRPHSPIRILKNELPTSFRDPTGHRPLARGDDFPYSPIRIPREFREHTCHRQTPNRIPADDYLDEYVGLLRGSKRSDGDIRPLSPIRSREDEYLDEFVDRLRGSQRSRRPIAEYEVIHGRPSSAGDYRPLSPIRNPEDEYLDEFVSRLRGSKRVNHPDPVAEATVGGDRPLPGRSSAPASHGDRTRDTQRPRLSPNSSSSPPDRILPSKRIKEIVTYWGREITFDKVIKSSSYDFVELPAILKLVDQQDKNVADRCGNYDPSAAEKLPVVHLHAVHPIPSRYLNQLSYYQLNCLSLHLWNNITAKRRSNHLPGFREEVSETRRRILLMQKHRRIEEKVWLQAVINEQILHPVDFVPPEYTEQDSPDGHLPPTTQDAETSGSTLPPHGSRAAAGGPSHDSFGPDYNTDVLYPGPGRCKWEQPEKAVAQFWYERELAYAAGVAGKQYYG